CKADANAADTVSVVRAAIDLIAPLTFETIAAIGVRSGLHGGNGTTRAPAPSTASTASSDGCGLRLSQTTTSPGFNSGTKTSSTSVSNRAVLVAPGKANAAVTPERRRPQVSVIDSQWPGVWV